jgi:hypothetical protein
VYCFAQKEKNLVAKYSFNSGKPVEDLGKFDPKVYGALLAPDRFGNSNCAYQLQGYYTSFINLGTSNELKPKAGTFSLWFKMDFPVAAGKGVEMNPILFTRCCSDSDFNDAFNIIYRLDLGFISVCNTSSKEEQLAISTGEKVPTKEWHHVVMCYDDKILGLYLDGKEVQTVAKNFEAKFLEGDSIMVGYRMKDKNERFFAGSVDDIEIYNKVLSPQEILEIYNAPNPNRYSVLIDLAIIIVSIIILIVLIVFLIRRRVKSLVRKEKERNLAELNSLEQQIKMLKAQMDPHFIFNSLNAILQFIVTQQNDKAELYLTKFSKLIRKLLESNTSEFISLEDELEILEKYLEIENLRFNSEIETQIEIDGRIDTYKTMIPHMMIQPFVENAAWHGLRQKQGPKILTIAFKKLSEKKLSCIIDDNGIGRRKNAGVQNGLTRSLAINFIKQRLELMSKKYDEDYNLTITDKMDANDQSLGTKVEICIPIIEN